MYSINEGILRLKEKEFSMKLFISGFLLLLFSSGLWAMETSIKGHLPGAENHEIRLTTYSDLLSYTEKILDRQIISDSSAFSFEVDLRETIVAFLDVEFYTFKLFLEPGVNYTLTFDTVELINEYRPYYQKEEMTCTQFDEPDPGLNFLIVAFDMQYNQFILDNFDNIYRRRNKTALYDFKATVNQQNDSIKNSYYNTYITYKIASVELAAASFARGKLFNDYIRKLPVQYNNTEYMYFLNQYFDQFLTSGTKSITRSDMQAAINKQSSYTALLDTLGKDTLLRNERIRELVMIQGLKTFYYSRDYSSYNVIEILRQLIALTRYPESKQMAENIMKSILHLKKGSEAPNFISVNLEGDTVHLEDFLGKPVYLSFMNTWSIACRGEFELMDSLYKKYGQKIQFITISFDKDLETIQTFAKEKNYNWTFLYNGTHYDLMKAYEIKTFPVFALISSKGNILQYPAYKPSETIEEAFEKLGR